MRLMVTGLGRHGKDTTAEIIEELTGMKATSSSSVAAWKIILPQWRELNIDLPHTKEEVEVDADYLHKYRFIRNNRIKWRNAIIEYNTPDRTRLAKDIFESSDIYIGCRFREEFLAAREANLFDLSIWVEATERKNREGLVAGDKSCCILQSDCDITLDNNGSEKSLREKLVRICNSWKV